MKPAKQNVLVILVLLCKLCIKYSCSHTIFTEVLLCRGVLNTKKSTFAVQDVD